MQLPLSSAMSNEEISQVFSFISQVLGMKIANRYRARAYEEASVVVQHLSYQLLDSFKRLNLEYKDQAAAEFKKKLDALPSIGEAISDKLTELFTTGDIKAFQKYVKNLPGGMYPLMKVHGIGAKRAYKLAKQFELTDPETAVAQLLTKAKHGLVSGLTGFGEKSEQALIIALEQQHQKARILRDQALAVAKQFEQNLLQFDPHLQVIFLGSLRRGTATVGDIDLGVGTEKPKLVVNHLKKSALVKRVLVAGENLLSVIVDNNWQVDIKFSPLAEWGSFIQHFTGDKQHNIKLREYALKKSLSLSEHGIKIKATGERKRFSDEAAFYQFLGLRLIPPAERVGGDELEMYELTKI